MDVKNEIAHVRFKTREIPDGKKALVVEEMQSDLVQGEEQYKSRILFRSVKTKT